MVDVTAQRFGQQAQQVLEERELTGIAIVAGSAAGGVIVGQYVADFVANILDYPVDPQTPIHYGVSILSKVATALAFGYAGAQLGGIALVAAALMGVGSLASAGVDIFEALLTTAPAGGEAPAQATTSVSVSEGASSTTQSSTARKTTASAGW